MEENNQPSRGVFASLRRLCDGGLALLQNRAELFAVEFQEQKARQVQILLWAGAVVFLGVMAVLLVTLTLIVAFWDTARMTVLIALSLFYMAAVAVAFFGLRTRLHKAPPPFSETISELQKDREWLNSRK